MTDKDPSIITLPEVRLSFPHLWAAHAMKADQKPSFSCIFIFDNTQHTKLLDDIDAVINRVGLDEFKKQINFKRCLRDGNEKGDLDGFGDGKSFISARSDVRPAVVDRRRNPVAEADKTIYAGCYVNATIRIWAQNNDYGKRVNAQLRAVQFVKDGAPFGAGPVDPNEEFQALDSDDATGAPTGTTTRSRSGTQPAKPSNLDEY